MDNKDIRRANMLMLEERLGSLKKLADGMDTDATYLSNIKNRVRDMGDGVARRFEKKLGVPHGWMDHLQVPGHRIGEPAPPEYFPHQGITAVPVVGTAQLGDNGFWVDLEHPSGHGEGFVRYPTRDPNAYALRVKGDSMRPRIKPGEFVVIEPNRPVMPGEEVMVQTSDGRSMIKQLGARRNGMVELLSINEDYRPITLDEIQVAKMHFVAAILKSTLYYELNV